MGSSSRSVANRLITLLSAIACLVLLVPGVAAVGEEANEAGGEPSRLIAREVRTIDASDLGVSRPVDIGFDAELGVFVVEGEKGGAASVVRVGTRWDRDRPSPRGGKPDSVILKQGKPVDAVGIEAVHPLNGLTYVLSGDGRELQALDADGQVVEAYDSSSAGLLSPSAMTFAPSSDITDDPEQYNLFIADPGVGLPDRGARSGRANGYNSFAAESGALAGGVTEVTLEQSMAASAASVDQAVLIQSIDTSAWAPPATDPSGAVWNSLRGELIVVDSEVNETSLFADVNVWMIDRSGVVLSTSSTDGPVSPDYSDEPTGVAHDPIGNILFVTDDTGVHSVYVVEAGPDGVVATGDDLMTVAIDVDLVASDPEDPEFLVSEGVLYFLSGVDREVFRIDPVDSAFGNGNDVMTSFDISHLGETDFEGMTSAPNRGTLYVASRNGNSIFEITTTGTLLRTIVVQANLPDLVHASGLAMAPSSTDPSVPSLWIADRAADEVNDGMMFEITAPNLDDPGSGNSAPIANDDTATTNVDVAVVVDVLDNDFDPNGDPMSLTNVTNGANGTTGVNGDQVTYTPSPGFIGTDQFTYQAFDGTATSNIATVSVTVHGPNTAPVAEDDSATTNQNTAVSINVLANDTDGEGDPLTVTGVSTPSNGSATTDGVSVTYTPNPGFSGPESFTYDVCDLEPLCDTGTITVTVRETSPIYYVSVDSSTTLPGIPMTVKDEDIVAYDATTGTWSMFFEASDVGITSSDLDAFHIRDDGSILMSYSSDNMTIPGLTGGPNGETVDQADLFLFTPTSTGDDTTGSFTFFFDGSDVGLDPGDEDLIGVFEFPDGTLGMTFNRNLAVPSVLGADEDIFKFTGTFGSTTTGGWSMYFDASEAGFASADELDGIFLADDLYFTTDPSYNAAGASGADEDISRFVGDPSNPATGTVSLEFDSSSVGLDPTLVVDAIHVGNLAPAAPNSAPVLAVVGDQVVDEGVELSFGASATDPDVPPQSLTFSLAGAVPAGASIDPVTGDFAWTPSEDQDGVHSFDVVVTDDGVPSESDSETITVTVNEVNAAPVADAGADQSGTVGVGVVLDGSGSSDPDLPVQTLTYAWSITSTPSGSSAASLADETTVSPTLTTDVAGDYVVSLIVSDGVDSSPADTVTITASAPNSAPVLAVVGDQVVDEGVELSFGASATDPDVPPQSLTFSLAGAVPAGASIDPVTGDFAWTPSEDQDGVHSFDVVVTDDGVPSESDSETITVTVNEVNAAPVADAGADQSGTVGVGVVLDGSGSSDPDLPVQTLTYAWSITSTPSGSSAASLADETTVSPTLTTDVAGDYVVSLIVSDGVDSSPADTVTITVTEPAAGSVYYISFSSTTSVPGIAGSVRDEDIVAYDAISQTWSMYFDASDVGITSSDLDAFHIRDNGEILISFSSDGLSVPGLVGGPDGELIDDSDVILFTPTSIGSETAGTFAFYFDGSDVDLTSAGEDIDGLFEFDDGSLGISTTGTIRVGSLSSGTDRDIHRFEETSFGSNTIGTWSIYFDGSDVGLSSSSYDLNAISLDSGGDLLFSTNGTLPTTSGNSDNEDIARFTGQFGSSTTGTIGLDLDLSAIGISTSENVDGLHVAD